MAQPDELTSGASSSGMLLLTDAGCSVCRASMLWSAITLQLVVGFFFRPNQFDTELQVHCYSAFPACRVIKCGKTGEFPPSPEKDLATSLKSLGPFCVFLVAGPLFTGYRASGSTVSSRWASAGALTKAGVVGLWSISWVCGAVTSNLYINTAVTGAHHLSLHTHTHTPVNRCLYVQTHTSWWMNE